MLLRDAVNNVARCKSNPSTEFHMEIYTCNMRSAVVKMLESLHEAWVAFPTHLEQAPKLILGALDLLLESLLAEQPFCTMARNASC